MCSGDNMQINRMFEIIYILLEKKTVTAKELADRFEVSVRTIYRDIESLSATGIPVFMSKGKGGGISLLSDFVLNKTVLTQDEKDNIISALNAIKTIDVENSSPAIGRLSSLFGKQNSNWIEIDFSDWGIGDKKKDNFLILKNAIINKNVVEFEYYSSKGEKTERTAESLKLCFKSRDWYLYAYCRQRKDNRFFKLSRMNNIVVLNEKVERIAPETVFEQEQRPFESEFITIKIKFTAEMAFMVYEVFDNYEVMKDGSFLVTAKMPNANWLVSYILSYGDQCEVLEPQEIRNKVKNSLEKISKKYL